MSNKIKSSLFLSSFVFALTIYNFSIDETETNFSQSSENIEGKFEQLTMIDNLQFEENN